MKYLVFYLFVMFFAKSLMAQNELTKNYYIDSIINNFFLLNYPDDDIKGNGRYYEYNSFRLPIKNRADTIKIINFGENSTHRPRLMMVLITSLNKPIRQYILGKESAEYDLNTLENLFLLFPLQEDFKLEILDIWLQSRKGILKTNCYIH